MSEKSQKEPNPELFMKAAMAEAHKAAAKGEVPVGAVIVHEGEIIARAHNLRETSFDPLAHAEILVIREAAAKLGRWRLSGCTLYVTLEPCPMCAGAIVNSRVDHLVFGAPDPRTGSAGSIMDIVRDERLNHQPSVTEGVLLSESRQLLQSFFAERRALAKARKKNPTIPS